MSSFHHARRTSTTIPTLSKQLQSLVPPCIYSCLSTYVFEGYGEGTACPDGELSCLCSRYSLYGFTLGELALTCLFVGNCRPETVGEQQEQNAFGLCSSQNNAVQATNTILSPPVTTHIGSPLTISTQLQATTQPPTTSTASGVSSTLPLIPTSSSSHSAAAANSSSGTPARSQGLTSEQAIGVSIGAVGFVVLAMTFAYLLVCIKRRRSKRVMPKHRDDFANEKPSLRSWCNFPASKDPDNEPVSEKSQTVWPSPQGRLESLRGRETATGARRSMSQESFRSSSSNRTVSRLLPEKPSRVQQRPGQLPFQPECVRTPATVFEEDRFSVVPRPVPSLPKNPRQPQYAHQFARHPQAAPHPSLSLNIPQQESRSGSIETVGRILLQENIPKPFYQCTKAASSSNSFLNYYQGAESDSPEDLYPYTPIDEHTQIRRPAPAAITITKPAFPPVAVRTSMISDTSRRTSFESTDPDEATPPDEAEEDDKRLTPVAESPIASIRYPKIPRGSNQVVPRSPPQPQQNHGEQWRVPITAQSDHHGQRRPTTSNDRMIRTQTPSSGGSTLAAKRLGDHAANNLERGLRIMNGKPPQEQTQQPRENANIVRDVSPSNWPLPSQESLKSPLWEPKLTPRRKGGDLYLSVSVATPRQDEFPER